MNQQILRIPLRALILLLSGFVLLPVSAQEVGVAFVARTELRTGSPQTALDRYLEKPDDHYSWKIVDEGNIGKTEYTGLILTSQRWKKIIWKHQLFLLKPKSCSEDCKQALLFIGGGSWQKELEDQPQKLPRDATRLALIAEQLKTPVAVLLQCPNQPIFDGKSEDQIIAYTFEKFVRTGDETWPLLLPMVKSAHRAIDATIEFAKKEWQLELEIFTATGASKRGWTTWLTGATDKRVNAIAPMVIDVLNMKPQMEHQRSAWGGFSNQIQDYTDRGLQDLLATERGRSLRESVDPYSYRKRITQPKLIFIGTNDPYWPIDAAQFYWDDLEEEKYLVYVPNNGHGLNDASRLVGSLNALHQSASGQKAMPQLDWKFETLSGQINLKISTKERAEKVQIWFATSDKRDFRNSKWKSVKLKRSDDSPESEPVYVYSIASPQSGSIAFFGEGIFSRGDLPCYVSTNVKVLTAKKRGSD
ncbi:PhoPQ-activated pathogenicity-related family protein [Pirellulaceae bacterium]|nr:PhoPQ-activated pathogenicity-related family protein [Pirellulaceae bacterium]